jgi:hypothetical protein
MGGDETYWKIFTGFQYFTTKLLINNPVRIMINSPKQNKIEPTRKVAQPIIVDASI